jgi:hypothetical protein
MEEVRGVRVFVMREGEGEGRACEKVNEGERGREERTAVCEWLLVVTQMKVVRKGDGGFVMVHTRQM